MKFVERKLGDLVNEGSLLLGDGYRAKNEELGGDGPIFLRAAYLQDTGFVLDQPDRFIELDNERFGAKVSHLGDVVITTKGNSTGRVGRVRSEQSGAIYSPHLSYWRSAAPDKIDQGFLYYWAQSIEFISQLRGMAHATDMAPYLSLRDQLQLRISLPEGQVQRAIGEVLGALDDKIELNRRINETLEAMARSIFKDWFVNFGPTRARMEGREPYLAPDIWSLFPDRLDDEGKPEGWRAGKLGDFVVQRVERAEPSDWTISNPYVPIDVIGAKSLSLLKSRPGAEARSSLTRFYRGDFLFGAMRPYFHKVCIAPFDGTTRTTVFVLAPRQQRDYAFSCMLLHDPMTIDYATNHSTGTTIPYATWKGSLEEMRVTIPTPEIRQAFHTAVYPILLKLPTTYFENRTLAATRDLLLPKLMSGEIRVRDAEKIAGEAT